MPRVTHLIALLLAVSLLAAGCGGGEEDASEEAEDARADGASEVTTDDGDQPDTVSDSAEQTEQPDADAEPEPRLEPAPARVRLGDRFPWCADIQALWEKQAQAQERFDEVEAALLAAQEALAAASDELDRAEAQSVLDAAEQRRVRAGNDLRRANRHLADLLWRYASDDTETIARQRAQDAHWEAADPTVQEIRVILLLADRMPPVTTTAPVVESGLGSLTVDEALAAIEDLHVRVSALGPAFDTALQDIGGLFIAVEDAETPGDLLAAHRTFTEMQTTLRSQETEFLSIVAAAASTNDWQEAYDAHARHNEAIPDDEYYASSDSIYSASKELEISINRIRQVARQSTEDSSFSSAREDAIHAFLVADAAGMSAFWASLSESCQP